MVRHKMLLVVSVIFVSQIAVRVGFGQDAAQEPEDTTVVGCLQAGAKTGEFVLINDDKATYQVQASEGIQVAAHVDHRVELTGIVEKSESITIFKVKALKMVSASCAL